MTRKTTRNNRNRRLKSKTTRKIKRVHRKQKGGLNIFVELANLSDSEIKNMVKKFIETQTNSVTQTDSEISVTYNFNNKCADKSGSGDRKSQEICDLLFHHVLLFMRKYYNKTSVNGQLNKFGMTSKTENDGSIITVTFPLNGNNPEDTIANVIENLKSHKNNNKINNNKINNNKNNNNKINNKTYKDFLDFYNKRFERILMELVTETSQNGGGAFDETNASMAVIVIGSAVMSTFLTCGLASLLWAATTVVFGVSFAVRQLRKKVSNNKPNNNKPNNNKSNS